MNLKLKQILESISPQAGATNEAVKMSKDQKAKILEMISQYNEYGKYIYAEHDLMEVANTLSEISNGVESFLMNESGDWFDAQTIKRNVVEMKKRCEEFNKIAQEGKSYQQRLAAVYEDMGHLLGRYFKINDAADETLPGKSTVTQATPREKPITIDENVDEALTMAGKERTETYLTTIKNPRKDPQAAQILQHLKAALSDRYTFQLHGRHPDRKGLAKSMGVVQKGTPWSKEMPVEHAETVDVYIYPKKPQGQL